MISDISYPDAGPARFTDVNVAEIRPMGRNTQGVLIMRVDEGDSLAAVVPVPPGEQEEADESPAPPEPATGEPAPPAE